jgi:hypothetical protein
VTFHDSLSEPGAIHPPFYVGAVDPASSGTNQVRALKVWLDTTGGGNVLKMRDAANSAWTVIGSLSHADLANLAAGNPHPQYADPFANLLTNPGLERWERGAGPFTANGAFAADRWSLAVGISSTMSVSRDAVNQDVGSAYCAAIAYTHVNVSHLWQLIEHYAQLRGRTVTFAVRVRTATANCVRPRIWDSVNAFREGLYHTGSGAYETLTVTAPIAATATGVQVFVQMGVSANVYVDNAVLVVGATAPAYVPLHPTEDLHRCQRYYAMWGESANELVCPLMCYSTNGATGAALVFPVEMATVPSLTMNNPTYFSLYNNTGTALALTTFGATAMSRRRGGMTVQVASGLTPGDASFLLATNAAARLMAEANP